MKFLQWFILAISLTALNAQWALASDDSMKGPWADDKKPGRLEYVQPWNPSFFASLLIKAIDLFQNHISPVDGPRSRHYPTSSAYSRRAIAEHGALLGFLLTVDRFIHEFIPSEASPVVYIGGAPRFYDPLEANDSWFSNRGKGEFGPASY